MEPEPEIRPAPDDAERHAIADVLERLRTQDLHPAYLSPWRRAALLEAAQGQLDAASP